MLVEPGTKTVIQVVASTVQTTSTRIRLSLRTGPSISQIGMHS